MNEIPTVSIFLAELSLIVKVLNMSIVFKKKPYHCKFFVLILFNGVEPMIWKFEGISIISQSWGQ